MKNLKTHFAVISAAAVTCLLVPTAEAQRGWIPTHGPALWDQETGWHTPKITCLAVDSEGRVYAGTAMRGVFISEKRGFDWMRADTGNTGRGIHCIAINRNDHVFVGGLGHASVSTDHGVTWMRIFDSPYQVWDFALDGDTTYMAAWTSVYRYVGVTDSAEHLGFFGDIRSIVVNPARRLFGTWKDSVDYIDLEDAGEGRKPFGGIPLTGTPVLELFETEWIFLGCSSGIYRSPQDTADWTLVNHGSGNPDVRTLCADRDTIYAGTFGGGVYASTNAGDAWFPMNDGLCDPHVNALCADGKGYLYAGTENGGVFRSASIPLPADCDDRVWSDEFDGPDIDTSIWTFDIGGGGWGNNELQYYTDRTENARIENGCLIIEAHREEYGGKSYTSARLKTLGLRCVKYGCIEVRARVPSVLGAWPAIWMPGNSIESVGWPACGEIDIMEHVNTSDVVHGAMHWWDTCHAYYGGTAVYAPDVWHVYGAQWTPSSISWFIDGRKFLEADIENGVNGTSEFHLPFHLLLNLAIGGNWPGLEVDTSQFPLRFEVDYVRVDTCGAGTGASVPVAASLSMRLDEIYPNPATGEAAITYELPARACARLAIHDMLGRVVAVLSDGVQEQGKHTLHTDIAGLRDGAYLCRLESGGASAGKVLIIRR